MNPSDHLLPAVLFLASLALLLSGGLVLRHRRGRQRWVWLWVCLIPAVSFVCIALRLETRLRRDARESARLFASLAPGPDLTEGDVEALRALRAGSLRVREGVLRLAFANSTNARVALPRLELLLHGAVPRAPEAGEPELLWSRVVEPALRKQPSREVVLLAAATAALGKYDAARTGPVLRLLEPFLAGETNRIARDTALGVFVPLLESASIEQLERAVNLSLNRLLDDPDPMRGALNFGDFSLDRARSVADLRRIGARLPDAAARRFADQVLAAMATQTNSSKAQALAWALEAVKSRLTPEQMDLALTNLMQQLPKARGGVLQERAGPLAGLAAVLPPRQAAAAARLLVDCLRQEPDRWWHDELSRPLKTLAARLNDDDVRQLAEPMEAVAPEVVELIRDRIPQEQVYLWMDRLIQGIIDTPNPTRRSAQVPRVAPLAVRLTPERAAKLVDELWRIFLRDADDSRRRDEAACLAALVPRTSNEHAMTQARLVVEQMQSPNADLPPLATVLNPLLERCAPATAQQAVACVMQRAGPVHPAIGSPAVQDRDLLVHAPFTPEQKASLIEPFVAGFESFDDFGRYMGLAMALESLADQLTTGQAERVAKRLILLYTRRPSPLAMTVLNSLATNVVFTPAQSKCIVDAILPRALESRMPDSDTFARCAGLFLRQLDPADAEAVGEKILEQMGRTREPMWAVLDARCFVPLAERLGPDAARHLAEQLLQFPARRGNQPGLLSLLEPSRKPFPAAADCMLPAAFLERQESRFYLFRLEAWSRSLAALMPRLDAAAAQVIADQVAARCAEQGRLVPLAFEPQTAAVLQHASPTALSGILQTPFGVGGLRRIVLRASELKPGTPPLDT